MDSAEDVRDDMRERDQNEHDFRLDGWVRWDMPGERLASHHPPISPILLPAPRLFPSPDLRFQQDFPRVGCRGLFRLLTSTRLTLDEHEP